MLDIERVNVDELMGVEEQHCWATGSIEKLPHKAFKSPEMGSYDELNNRRDSFRSHLKSGGPIGKDIKLG